MRAKMKKYEFGMYPTEHNILNKLSYNPCPYCGGKIEIFYNDLNSSISNRIKSKCIKCTRYWYGVPPTRRWVKHRLDLEIKKEENRITKAKQNKKYWIPHINSYVEEHKLNNKIKYYKEWINYYKSIKKEEFGKNNIDIPKSSRAKKYKKQSKWHGKIVP
jgi:hypothetical protein